MNVHWLVKFGIVEYWYIEHKVIIIAKLKIKAKTEDAKDDSTWKKLCKYCSPDIIDSGIYKVDFKELFKNTDIEIDGFEGGVEVDTVTEDSLVPSNFPNSSYTDENEVEHQKTWKEYVSNSRIKRKLDGLKIILPVGFANSKGNREDIVSDEELRAWIDEFGVDNILTLSEMKTLLASEDYSISEE